MTKFSMLGVSGEMHALALMNLWLNSAVEITSTQGQIQNSEKEITNATIYIDYLDAYGNVIGHGVAGVSGVKQGESVTWQASVSRISRVAQTIEEMQNPPHPP